MREWVKRNFNITYIKTSNYCFTPIFSQPSTLLPLQSFLLQAGGPWYNIANKYCYIQDLQQTTFYLFLFLSLSNYIYILMLVLIFSTQYIIHYWYHFNWCNELSHSVQFRPHMPSLAKFVVQVNIFVYSWYGQLLHFKFYNPFTIHETFSPFNSWDSN